MRTVAFSADGKTFAVGGDGGLEIRDTANPDDQKQVTPDNVQGVAFSPDGASVVYGQTNGSVTRFNLTADVAEPPLKATEPGRGIDGNTVAVSVDSSIAVGFNDGTVILRNPAGKHQEIALPVSPGQLTAPSSSIQRARGWLPVTIEEETWWWDVNGLPEIRHEQSEVRITSVAFSPNGATLAASDQSGLIGGPGTWRMGTELICPPLGRARLAALRSILTEITSRQAALMGASRSGACEDRHSQWRRRSI